MRIITRSGNEEEIKFDLITEKIKHLSSSGIWGEPLNVDPIYIAQTICGLIRDGITTRELDEFSASMSATLFKEDPDYLILAGRIAINNHNKNTIDNFYEKMIRLNEYKIISDNFINNLILINPDKIQNIIDYNKDYEITYFGFKSLEKSYLLKIKEEIIERPQDLFMRVALSIHQNDLENVKKTYESLSSKYYTHATPTLFNAGTRYQQMSSCFLIGTEDSVDGLYKTASDMANISKWAGGIGVHISNVRAKDSYINKTGGKSNGIMPLLKVYNDISRHINQSGKRNGSFAVYIEPWHADIDVFLEAKKNNGAEELRARDLFYALWIPDLFMKRVEQDGDWCLMCPNECPGLDSKWGYEFEELYNHYENEMIYRKKIKAKDLWEKIINSQIETGLPYILYKDTINRKSNQKNYGIIKSSNLCTEIVEYSDSKETAVCNLASLCLPSYISNFKFNFELLGEKTQELVHNLNNIIDINDYPTSESEFSNKKHRPIGIGVQGLADVFMILKFPFESAEAKKLNRDIFECIYYNSLVMSNKIAKNVCPYDTFKGSPISQGIFQFDMWNVKPSFYSETTWDDLKLEIIETGVRNSLLVAPMPTASTAQIMGNNESFEPYTSNLYTRNVMSGNFVIVNNHLIKELKSRNLYSKSLINELIINRGSVKNLNIPQDIKDVYKTSWEMQQKHILDMAIERGAFICQSQSLNLFVDPPKPKVLHSIHFYGWKNGLKTGSYYIRTKPPIESQRFSMEHTKEKECTMCSA